MEMVFASLRASDQTCASREDVCAYHSQSCIGHGCEDSLCLIIPTVVPDLHEIQGRCGMVHSMDRKGSR